MENLVKKISFHLSLHHDLVNMIGLTYKLLK